MVCCEGCWLDRRRRRAGQREMDPTPPARGQYKMLQPKEWTTKGQRGITNGQAQRCDQQAAEGDELADGCAQRMSARRKDAANMGKKVPSWTQN